MAYQLTLSSFITSISFNFFNGRTFTFIDKKLNKNYSKNETEELIDYIAQPDTITKPTQTVNKPLPELVSFQDIVEIITTDNNILSNENAFVSENTKESIRILVINERTGKEQDITLKKERDGSLAQNSYKIIYLRKEGDEEDNFDHEEFKSTFKNMVADNIESEGNENDIQTEDIVKIRIKKDDKVKVLTGKDKGKIGKVLKVVKKTNRVVVENINVVKVHQRPTQANPQGGIVDKTMPINVSNLMVMCNSCVKPTRIGIKQLEDGKRVRICKKCNQQIDS